MTHLVELDTRGAIISAAVACFRNQGPRKTTIVDITRAAEVSRSTFYEYFRDKESIVKACAQTASQSFYCKLAQELDRGGAWTLEDKLVRAAVFVTQSRRVLELQLYFDQDEVGLMLTKNAAPLLRECGDFFTPYVSAAKLTGEVRSNLDVASGTEWIARMFFSLFMTPSPSIDARDDREIADFVRAFIVRGFSPKNFRPR
jgi:AcrR family transcriptional regulator